MQSKAFAITKQAIGIAFPVSTAKAIAITSCDASYDSISDISMTYLFSKFKLMPLSLKSKGIIGNTAFIHPGQDYAP